MDTVLIGSTQEMVTCDCERVDNTLEITWMRRDCRQYIGDLHGYSSHRFHTGDGDL